MNSCSWGRWQEPPQFLALHARQMQLCDSQSCCNAQGRLDLLQAQDGRLMQAAGDIFATSQAASTLADISEAWRLSPDLGAALLAGDCLRLLEGGVSCLRHYAQ